MFSYEIMWSVYISNCCTKVVFVLRQHQCKEKICGQQKMYSAAVDITTTRRLKKEDIRIKITSSGGVMSLGGCNVTPASVGFASGS